MKTRYLTLLLYISISCIYADNLYQPNISLSLKKGNQRDMARMGLVLPIAQNQTSLLYLTTIGLMDTRKAKEGNFGLGYRHRYSDYILGGYVFYDIRKSRFNNVHHQLTFGGEYLRKHFEFRFNAYLPVTKSKTISKAATASLNPYTGIHTIYTSQKMDVPMGGFDIELGGSMPSMPRLNVFGAYYRFSAKGVSPVHGLRARGIVKVNDYLSLDAEISHDKARGTAHFLGATLKYQLGHKKHKQDALWHKMTMLPVRDVDIVTGINIEEGTKVYLTPRVERVEGDNNNRVDDVKEITSSSTDQSVLRGLSKAVKDGPSGALYGSFLTTDKTNKINYIRQTGSVLITEQMANDVSQLLNDGYHMTIRTMADSKSGPIPDYDITLATNAHLRWDSKTTLSLYAHRNIIFKPGSRITIDGPGSLVLRSDSEGVSRGTVIFESEVPYNPQHIHLNSPDANVFLFYNPRRGAIKDYSNPTDYDRYIDTQGAMKDFSYVMHPDAMPTTRAFMLVNNVEELQMITDVRGVYSNNYVTRYRGNLEGHYAQGKGIDASTTSTWNPKTDKDGITKYRGFLPIGGDVALSIEGEITKETLGNIFTGEYFGNFHAIEGFQSHALCSGGFIFGHYRHPLAGLFGAVNKSTIHHVTLKGANISGLHNTRLGLVAYAHTGNRLHNLYVPVNSDIKGGPSSRVGVVGSVHDHNTISSITGSGRFTGGHYSFVGVVGSVHDHNTISNITGSARFTGREYSYVGVVGFVQDHNTISNLTGSGAFTGGGDSRVGVVGSVHDHNTISNITGSGRFTGGAYSFVGVVGSVHDHNTISNLTGSGAFTGGKLSRVGVVGSVHDHNTISNITGSGRFTGGHYLYVGVVGSVHDHNTISNLTGSGAFTAGGDSRVSVVGSVYDHNTISNLTGSGAFTAGDDSRVSVVGSVHDHNTISNLTGSGAFTGGKFSSVGVVGSVECHNTISNLTGSGAFTAGRSSRLGVVGFAYSENTISNLTGSGAFTGGKFSRVGVVGCDIHSNTISKIYVSGTFSIRDGVALTLFRFRNDSSDGSGALETRSDESRVSAQSHTASSYMRRISDAFAPGLYIHSSASTGYHSTDGGTIENINKLSALQQQAIKLSFLSPLKSYKTILLHLGKHFGLNEQVIYTYSYYSSTEGGARLLGHFGKDIGDFFEGESSLESKVQVERKSH